VKSAVRSQNPALRSRNALVAPLSNRADSTCRRLGRASANAQCGVARGTGEPKLGNLSRACEPSLDPCRRRLSDATARTRHVQHSNDAQFSLRGAPGVCRTPDRTSPRIVRRASVLAPDVFVHDRGHQGGEMGLENYPRMRGLRNAAPTGRRHHRSARPRQTRQVSSSADVVTYQPL
jgi:hypothetical protein